MKNERSNNILFTTHNIVPTTLFAEVTRKDVRNSYGTTEIVFSAEGKEVARKILDKDGSSIKTIGKIPDGTVKQYYDSGALFAEWNYKNGKLNGTKKYYEGGALRATESYKNDTLEGLTKAYFPNGQLEAEWNYKNGKLEGLTKEYHTTGTGES